MRIRLFFIYTFRFNLDCYSLNFLWRVFAVDGDDGISLVVAVIDVDYLVSHPSPNAMRISDSNFSVIA